MLKQCAQGFTGRYIVSKERVVPFFLALTKPKTQEQKHKERKHVFDVTSDVT